MKRRNVPLFIVWLVVTVAACAEADRGRLAMASAPEGAPQVAPGARIESVSAEPGSRQPPVGSTSGAAVAADDKGDEKGDEKGKDKAAPPDEKLDDGDDGNEDDYWNDVKFGKRQFEEVLSYVDDYYIDDDFNASRAYAEAANFALMGAVPDVRLELLPVQFHQARKGHPDEEGELDGKTFRLQPDDPFLVHVAPKSTKDKPKKRLDDEALRALKTKTKERSHLLEEAWSKITFTRKEFDRVIAYVRSLEKGDRAAWEQGPGVKTPQPVVKMNRVWIAAAQGYLFSLDPHSTLVNRKAWDESVKETEDGSFDGIGAILLKRGDDILIESPIEGQPAHKVGLRAGDTILRVDDVDVSGMELTKVVKMIRGPRGTNVKLTVRRISEPDDIEAVITRAHIDVPNVQGKLLSDHNDVANVKVTGFVESTPMKLEEELGRLARKTTTGRLRGLVLDLRNNPGGLLDAAIALSDLFLSKGKIVIVKNSFKTSLFNLKRDEVHEATSGDDNAVPLVVLVNEGSASASEIVASALQENGRSLVVGRRTFGKASVQTLLSPKAGEGYYIKLTVSRYYGPSAKTLQAVGVVPDVEIPEEPGKPMPVSFREEDLTHHLDRVDEDDSSEVNRAAMARVSPCVKKRGIAERLFKANPNAAIKFDYELYLAADVLECFADAKVGKAQVAE